MIEDRGSAPTGFRSIRSHTVRDDAQTCRSPRLCRELQAPPLTQIERAGHVEHNIGQRTVLERLFGHSKCIHLILGAGQQKLRRIDKRQQPLWRQSLRKPRFPDPQHMPPHSHRGKGDGSGSADLMDAGTA